MMRFGLCADIRKIKDVEAWGYDYMDAKLNQIAAFTDEEFEDVVRLAASSTLKVERMSLLFPKTMVVIGEKYNKDEMVAYLEKAFSRMTKLGCSLIVFGSGKSRLVPEGMRWQDAFSQLVEVTKVIGTVAKKYNVTIAIEPLNRSETNLINSLAEGAALQAMVGMDNVGLLADAFHMRKEGEDMGRILTCSPLMHTHIALKEGRAYPTERTDEVIEFMDYLKKAGYDGTLSIEGKSDDMEKDSRAALTVLRSFV